MSYTMPKHFAPAALTAAYEAALKVSTENGKSRGGWVRLARAAGSAAEPYVIAVRKLKDGRIQFACGCPHWKFRCQSKGELCKHQMAVLCNGLSPKGKIQVWYYKAGECFVSVLTQKVMAGEAA